MLGIKPHPACLSLMAIDRLEDAMRTTLIGIGALFLSPVYLTDAFAQPPAGQVPTYLTANPGYVGQPLTYTNRLPNGAYVAHPFGQQPIFSTPTPNGGSVIQQPGQQPTYTNPQ